MPAQPRDSRRNFIGIVNDRVDEQRAVESLAKSDHLVKDFFVAVMAVVLKRQDETRS